MASFDESIRFDESILSGDRPARESHFISCTTPGLPVGQWFRTHVLEVKPESSSTAATETADRSEIKAIKSEGEEADEGKQQGSTERIASGSLDVVAVHGLTRNHQDFVPLAAHLAREGRRSYCVDVVGRGKSDVLDNPQGYNYATYTSSLATVLSALLQQSQCYWVGTSMGALIGMMLAAARGSPIRALVMNDVGPFVSAASVQRLVGYVGKEGPWPTFAEALAHTKSTFSSFGELTEEQWQFFTQSGVHFDASKQLYCRNYDPRIAEVFGAPVDVDLFPIWQQVRCPVLLFHGRHSDILSVETIERMHRERHPEAPPLQVVTIDNCGHAPALLDPFQMSTISRFLSEN